MVSTVLLEPENETDDFEESGRAERKTLRIEIDWRANGKAHENEVILLPKAAESLAKFISRLAEELGPDVLQKLSRLRVNRGPLLSKSPSADFVNQAQGKLYGHKRVPTTDYYVLTHSQTSQKVEDLERVCRVVRLAPGSVQIRAVSRADYYAEIYS